MSSPRPLAIRVTRRLPFSPERVFDAWLNPEFAAKWLFATTHGRMVRAEADPRVGGRFIYTDRRAGEDIEHTGEYLEIDRPRRLVFTFGVPAFSSNFDRVTVEIAPLPSGCELTLIHELKPENAAYQYRSQYGWTHIVESLAANLGEMRAATNLQPGGYTAPGELRLVRLLPGPIERVWDYLVDSEKRARWFAGGMLEPRVGGRVELHFRHLNLSPDEKPTAEQQPYHDPGVTMTGEVTHFEPPRRVSFRWPIDDEHGGPSEVTFELTPLGEDVELVLTHRCLGEDRDLLTSVGAGWHTHVALLIAQLAGNSRPPFWAMHERLKGEYAGLLEESLGR